MVPRDPGYKYTWEKRKQASVVWSKERGDGCMITEGVRNTMGTL